MKIKKIGAICNAGGVYYLMNQRDYAGEVRYQWLGDGRSAYPLVGLPLMDLENICAMFDITEKKRDKLLMRMMDAAEAVNWDDTDPAERRLKDPKLCVRYDGRDLLPLETSAGITFIQEKYLAPLDSLEYMQLYERRGTDGGLYIVAKIGMIIQAIIMPMDLPDEAFMGLLGKLTHQCRAAFNRRKRNAECGMRYGYAGPGAKHDVQGGQRHRGSCRGRSGRMSDRMKKALRDGGKITVTIQYNYMTGFHYDIREEAFRLTGIASGEIANEALAEAPDPDALIQEAISEAVRKNHIAWEARE